MNITLHNMSDGSMAVLKDGDVGQMLCSIRFLGPFVDLDPTLKQSVGEGAFASLLRAVALKEKIAADLAAIEAAKSAGPTPRKGFRTLPKKGKKRR